MKRATMASLHGHGVRLLMGTDLPNPLMVAGFAVHEELAALVRAGLTPFDAIATATRNAGEFMGGDRFGTMCRAREPTSSSLPTIPSLTWPACGSRGR